MRRAELMLLSLAAALVACAPEGDPSAFVTFNVPPNGDCIVSPSSVDLFIPIGLYDVSPGFSGEDFCERPYYVNLLINSFLASNSDPRLGRSEPNILQIHSAEVRLLTVDGAVIDFDRSGAELPNPFLVTTNNSLPPARGDTPSTGIATVEAIPTAYGPHLDMWIGSQIIAEIQIFGTTTGDIDVDFRPFRYPIELCDGCLTVCQQRDIEVPDRPESDFVDPDDCQDNAGADGRVCIDPFC